MDDAGEYMDHCTFKWSIADVPLKSKFYEVHITHRDGPKYTRAEIKKGIDLTLS